MAFSYFRGMIAGVFLCLFAGLVIGQTVFPASDIRNDGATASSPLINFDREAFFERTSADIKSRLIAESERYGQSEQIAIIRNTQILLDDDIPLHSIAFAIHDEHRQILISAALADALEHYAGKLQVIVPTPPSKTNTDTGFMVEFISDTRAKPKDYASIQQQIMRLAYTDILLHEFGHHMMDAFYSDYASPFLIHRAENTAESWNQQMKRSLDVKDNNLGKFVTLASVLYHLNDEKGPASENAFLLGYVKRQFTSFCQSASYQDIALRCQHVFNELDEVAPGGNVDVASTRQSE